MQIIRFDTCLWSMKLSESGRWWRRSFCQWQINFIFEFGKLLQFNLSWSLTPRKVCRYYKVRPIISLAYMPKIISDEFYEHEDNSGNHGWLGCLILIIPWVVTGSKSPLTRLTLIFNQTTDEVVCISVQLPSYYNLTTYALRYI